MFKQVVILIIILSMTLSAFGQAVGGGVGPTFGNYIPVGFRPTQTLGTWSWNLDPALTGTLNQAGDVFTGPTQLLVNTEDMTGAVWATSDATVFSAVRWGATARYGNISQDVTTTEGELNTLYLRGYVVSGTPLAKFLHIYSPIGSTSTLIMTGTSADYAITVPGKAGGGAITFGMRDSQLNPDALFEVTRWAVIPGEWSAEEAAAIYQTVAANNQTAHDWSGNGNDACAGADCDAGTDDPSNRVVAETNLLAAGSTEDLTNAAWTLNDASGNASLDSATQFTFGAHATDLFSQPITTTEGSTYILSVTLNVVSGDPTLRVRRAGSATGDNGSDFEAAATPTQFTDVFLGKVGGGTVSLGLRNGSDAAAGIFTVDEWQLTQVPSGWSADDPLPYQSSAEPSITCLMCDYSTDDFSTVIDSETSMSFGTGSYAVLFRADSWAGSPRLFAKRTGSASQIDILLHGTGGYLHCIRAYSLPDSRLLSDITTNE